MPDNTFDVRIDARPASTSVLVDAVSSFHTVTIDAGDTLHLLPNGELGWMGPSIQNSGTLHVDASGSSDLLFMNLLHPHLTIGGGGTIILDRRLDVGSNVSEPIVNLDNTIRGGLSIHNSLENHGTIVATPGKSVVLGLLQGSVRNTGRIAAENASVVALWGVTDNDQGVVEAEDGGIVQIADRGFSGGLLKTSGSGIVTFPYGNLIRDALLSDFTLDGVFRFGTPSYGAGEQTAKLRGTIHNVGTIDVVPVGRTATLEFGISAVPVTLTGGGFINLGSDGTAVLRGAGLLTDNTIRGSGRIMTRVQTSGRIIASPGGTLHIAPFVNTGTIQVESGGHMQLGSNGTYTSTGGAIQIDPGGTFSILPSGLILNAGSMQMDGMLDMQNGTLNATHIAGTGVIHQSAGQINSTHLRISSASISGGTTKITPGGGSLGTSRLAALSVTDAGRLDLSDHDLILDYPADAPVDPSEIRSLLASAYSNGSWSGPGLTSSAAAASGPSNRTALGYLDNTDAAFTEFSGQSVDDTSVLVKYTLAGDATFDGLVNLADLIALANHWQMQGLWVDGDFDYNGVIDQADLGLLAGNWNGSIDDALQAVGLDGVSIPEPAAGCLILAPALVIRRRRS